MRAPWSSSALAVNNPRNSDYPTRPKRLRDDLGTVAEPETVALDLTGAACSRRSRAGETWRILFADVGEAFIFCPECAEREFGSGKP